MPRRFFRRLAGDTAVLRTHPRLRFFGPLLRDHRLWQFHRRTLAGATAIGLFVACIPLPLQVVYAAALAIAFRVNLPVAITLIWVTNPITIPPLLLVAYKLGAVILGLPPKSANVEFSLEWMMAALSHSWQPLLLGCLILAGFSAIAGYFTVHWLWVFMVRRAWRRRHLKRKTAPELID